MATTPTATGIPVPSPTGYGSLYYPTQGQMQPDPFHGRFGNNPGLLSYLLATGQPQWGQPGGILGGNPATNPPGTNPGAPPPGGTGQPGGAPGGTPSWVGGGGHGNGGHAPGGLGQGTPGGMDAGLGNFNGSGMGPAAPGMTIGDALMNAMSPMGTMIGAMLGNNQFSPAGYIGQSVMNMGRGLLSGNSAANGYGGAITGAAAQGRAAAGGQAGGIGGGRGGVGGNGPMGGNGGQGANAGF